MKQKILLLFMLVAGATAQFLTAQVAPVVSTTNDTTWYYIESAKSAANANTGTLPVSYLKNYVIYSPTANGNILYRLRTYTDDEKWAIVNVGGVNKLMNKTTRKYATGTYQVNSTGEEFKWVNYSGTMQYKISTASYNPLIAYSSLTCNRNSDLGVNSQTAWYFKKASEIPSPQAPKTALPGDTTWYFIESAKSSSTSNIGSTTMKDFKDYVLYSPSSNPTTTERSMYHMNTFTDVDKWALVNKDGMLMLMNKATRKYMNQSWNVSPTGDDLVVTQYAGTLQYSIKSGGQSPVIAYNNFTSDRYAGLPANSQTAWYFWPVTSWLPTPKALSQVTQLQGCLVTGRGNTNFAVIYFDVSASGATGLLSMQSIRMNLTGTTGLSDISNLRIYKTTGPTRFNAATDSLKATAAITSGDFDVTFDTPVVLNSGDNFFCVVVDITEGAAEGGLVDAGIVSATPVGGTAVATTGTAANAATIFLTQHKLFSPGDYGSVSYRIPAIVTAHDGSLVTWVDKRNNNSGDLPNNIDQYVRRSTDNGKTWSTPLMVCGNGDSQGYGDPAMVVDNKNGKIIALINYGSVGFFSSTSTNPLHILKYESTDNGQTWTGPVDLTNQLYGSGSSNPATKNWAGVFVSSGRGLQLRNGRLAFAGVVRDGVNSAIQNYVFYSDDFGTSWTMGTNSAIDGGDEAKLAERNNGDLLMSIRHGGGKRYTNVSTTQGTSWITANATVNSYLTDPACNGEIMTYTSTLDGYNKNRMLHSLAYNSGSRQNVSILVSYDEGVTWPKQKTICPTSSAYSTFTVLPDGTIGMYYEDGYGGTFDMQYVRFSLNWATGGTDTYTAPAATSVSEAASRNITARADNGRIVITGSDAPFRVYNVSGTEMPQQSRLKTGMYLIRVENQTLKLIVR
ncbi:MAG: exo-alpha-sialidase [Paludibacteraceae bacterium]|uniref:exo-alpha-sialidase n=1 Tax=Macellibacteroides fermentans TaxID=879969 RepID=UPI00352F887A